MLAPIILQRQDTLALPRDEEKPDKGLQQLKELLELLDEMTPRTIGSDAAAAPATSTLDQTLQRLVERITALENAQVETRQFLSEGWGSTVQTLEKASEAMVRMQQQIKAVQQRLDKLDPDGAP